MQKISQERLTISEAADITGYPPYVLRFYEKEFNLKVPRTDNNQRFYTEREIEMMNKIKILKDRGVSNNRIKMELGLVGKDEKNTYNNENEQFILNELENIKKELFKLDMITEALMEIKDELNQIKVQSANKENDLLIVENARLKMKLKEKTYELVELKEKLIKGKYAKV
ncbi:MAG: MerR family transcriptional regulator [Eubacteriaceae bacterium]|nr:MerR family transcriptional regulator [Eubacteriaceae bacterium]